MKDRFKVCGNCGNCTMESGEYLCIDPAKQHQEVVQMGERRPCFVVTPLTAEQQKDAMLSPACSTAVN